MRMKYLVGTPASAELPLFTPLAVATLWVTWSQPKLSGTTALPVSLVAVVSSSIVSKKNEAA